MAYGDKKEYKGYSRGSGWTKDDQKREDKRKAKEAEQHRKFLAGLSPEGRAAYDAEQQRLADADREEHLRWEQDYINERKERDAERESAGVLQAGYIVSDFAAAIRRRERFDLYEGDWLEDPVEALATGRGFAEEYSVKAGIKLHINLCLDCSNSMPRNNVDQASVKAFALIYQALRLTMQALPPESLTVDMWKWAQGDSGKTARRVELKDNDYTKTYLSSAMDRIHDTNFNGESTWLHPLLEQIAKREAEMSSDGVYRLDVILTDGVLEHPTDKGLCDKIQTQRDGNLQTVILNFLPIEEWGQFAVPDHAVQYGADAENISALMRSALGDWLRTI